MFEACYYLDNLDVSNFETFNVLDMNKMFSGCANLLSLDLSSFSTYNVTDMRQMFYYCPALLRLDVSNFDTSKVANMYGMFSGCSSLESLDLSYFSTSQIANSDGISGIFDDCESLLSVTLGTNWTFKVQDGTMIYLPDKVWYNAEGDEFSSDALSNKWDSQTMYGTYSVSAPDNAIHTFGDEGVLYYLTKDNGNVVGVATGVCTVCKQEITEVVEAGISEYQDATCETPGYIVYVADFFNPSFDDKKSFTDVIPAQGHSYGEPKYEWSDGFVTCKASAECSRCDNVIDETVTAKVTTYGPTDEYDEYTKYVAEFKNSLFKTQSFTDGIEPPAATEVLKVYRLWNKVTGEHLFTTDEYEYNTLPVNAPDWQQEPTAKTWASPSTGTIGVYRLYNTVSGDHHYTTDLHEVEVLTDDDHDWKLDNNGDPLFYSVDPQIGIPVYRLFNADPTAYVGSHHYTTDQNEKDTLINWSETGKISAKWQSDGSYDGVEGIGWYGLPTED
jgi:surface protein